jgi:predicted RNA-binding protein YlqC (UPF0109 family)
MKQIIEDIAKALVDNPDQVTVKQIDGDHTSVFELSVAQSDLGKVIGKEGRTAGAMRLLLTAGGMKINRRYSLEIME